MTNNNKKQTNIIRYNIILYILIMNENLRNLDVFFFLAQIHLEDNF